MTAEQFTKEWLDSLSDSKKGLAISMYYGFDFLVMGDAMPFIEEVAPACGYNIIPINLQTLDDLRGTPVAKHDEISGLDYFEYEVEWLKAVKKSEKKPLVIFNIDDADDRLVNGIKSFIERKGDKYSVGLICSDASRDLKHTTTYNLVKPAIRFDC